MDDPPSVPNRVGDIGTPPQLWHCGNGGDGGDAGHRLVLAGVAKTKKEARFSIYVESIKNNHCVVGFGVHGEYFQEQSRWKHQLKPFLVGAKRGDKIFLHCSHLGTDVSVSHYGIYTGKCERAETICGVLVQEPIWLIKVEKWIPLQEPFRGAGKYKTLYKVEDDGEHYTY